MSATENIAAWQQAVDRATEQYTPFPAGWINQLPPELATELKGIAAMCDEAHGVLVDASALLQDIMAKRGVT